jgi:hypothetical protein
MSNLQGGEPTAIESTIKRLLERGDLAPLMEIHLRRILADIETIRANVGPKAPKSLADIGRSDITVSNA